MNEVIINIEQQETFSRFLSLSGFEVEELGNDVYRVVRDEELPVFVKIIDEGIFFEVDLGNVKDLGADSLYFELLDLNTEILPVSFGIDNSNPEDARLVLVESREAGSLNDHEILCVFDALELAVDKAEALFTSKNS